MEQKINTPARQFKVGHKGQEITLNDCAHIRLNADEQITLETSGGHEFDIVRKSWGYYATPSLNGRLVQFNLKTALVKSYGERYYILLVEKEKLDEFMKYIAHESMELIAWIDNTENLKQIENSFK